MDYMSSNMEVSPSSGFAYDLVNRVARGEIVPAKFQRPYVWSRDDVLALFRSIMMNISIGSFLIWEPSPDMDIDVLGRDRLGPVRRQTKSGYGRPTGLLLDGQNRLATIAWARHAGPIPEGILEQMSPQEIAVWGSGETIVLDHATRDICFVPDEEAEIGLRLPLSTVIAQNFTGLRIATERFERKFGAAPEDVDEMIRLYERCGRRFTGARAADMTIKNATAEEARQAFLNICRVGVPMSQEDFDNAVQWKAPV